MHMFTVYLYCIVFVLLTWRWSSLLAFLLNLHTNMYEYIFLNRLFFVFYFFGEITSLFFTFALLDLFHSYVFACVCLFYLSSIWKFICFAIAATANNKNNLPFTPCHFRIFAVFVCFSLLLHFCWFFSSLHYAFLLLIACTWKMYLHIYVFRYECISFCSYIADKSIFVLLHFVYLFAVVNAVDIKFLQSKFEQCWEGKMCKGKGKGCVASVS